MLSQIEQHLFLSCWVEYAPQSLRDAKIGCVLTVALDCIPKIRHLPNVVYRHIRMLDVESEELLKSQKLHNALEYVEESVNNRTSVVVHCQCGISRSPTVVMAYLMRKYKWSVSKAFSYVRKRRSCIQPNQSFLRQLELFEKLEFRCDSLTLRNVKLFKEFECISNDAPEVKSNYDVYSLNESANYSIDRRRFSCKRCRCDLFYDFNVLSHNIFVPNGDENINAEKARKCDLMYLLTPMEWMEIGEQSGKIVCFNCHEKIGHYNWHGKECLSQSNGSLCRTHVTPWFHIPSTKVDSFEMTKNK